ncbi:ATP-binding protein [Streptomyces catenulae]|uniref:ATP-binding protein n=1 Tax=Streptomyces catenulae TaxID=66875 RepID=UPI001FDF55F9|nr:ATP-binding protein [Streptomyces catenulae]
MRHCSACGRFPVQSIGEFIPWRGAKEVSGVALMVAQEVPTSSIMAVPHGPAGVGMARRRMRGELSARGIPDTVIDDAALVLSELLSNACRHARPLDAKHLPDTARDDSGRPGGAYGSRPGSGAYGPRQTGAAYGPEDDHGEAPYEAVLASWRVDERERLTVAVTDGGGPTRPRPATPSITARGGRGLAIIRSLSRDWGVRDVIEGETTVWAELSLRDAFADRVAMTPTATAATVPAPSPSPEATYAECGGPAARAGLPGLPELSDLADLSAFPDLDDPLPPH